MPFAPAHPVGGVDHPRTFRELEAWFPDDLSCPGYLARLRQEAIAALPQADLKKTAGPPEASHQTTA